MRGKVMTALLYPTILLVLALAVLIFLLVFFIPRFQAIFTGFGASLPLLTQLIVGVSHTLRAYGPILAIGLGVAVFMVRTWVVSPTGRRTWEGAILRLPAIGGLVAVPWPGSVMLGVARGRVPLISSLNVARRSIGNQLLVDAVAASIDQVKEGKSLGVSLSACRTLFSGATIEMISVAEESGKLDQELVRIANVTEGDLDRQLRTAVALAEPLMLFLIAAFIGTIFIGMVIPIFTLQDYISSQRLTLMKLHTNDRTREIRNPKSEIRRKPEGRKNAPWRRGGVFRHSGFGVPSGLRTSDFGLRRQQPRAATLIRVAARAGHPRRAGGHCRAQVLGAHRAGEDHRGHHPARDLRHGARRLRGGQWLLPEGQGRATGPDHPAARR
jgi:hypothetical protein